MIKVPKNLEKKCRKELADYLFRAAKQDLTINQIAKGIGKGMDMQTLTRFKEGDQTMKLSTWDKIKDYMDENPV